MKPDTLIMAGGNGTRLKPLTDIKPKSLIEIDGKTIIQRLIDQLPREINQILISINHDSGPQIRDHIGSLYQGMSIEYIYRSMPGTMGCVIDAKSKIGGSIVVSSADNIYSKQDIEIIYKTPNSILYYQYNIFKTLGTPFESTKSSLLAENQLGCDNKKLLINTGLYHLPQDIINKEPITRSNGGEYGIPQTLNQHYDLKQRKHYETNYRYPIGTHKELDYVQSCLKFKEYNYSSHLTKIGSGLSGRAYYDIGNKKLFCKSDNKSLIDRYIMRSKILLNANIKVPKIHDIYHNGIVIEYCGNIRLCDKYDQKRDLKFYINHCNKVFDYIFSIQKLRDPIDTYSDAYKIYENNINRFIVNAKDSLNAIQKKESPIILVQLDDIISYLKSSYSEMRVAISDFQSHNVMIYKGLSYLLDFQDMIFAPKEFDFGAFIADGHVDYDDITINQILSLIPHDYNHKSIIGRGIIKCLHGLMLYDKNNMQVQQLYGLKRLNLLSKKFFNY